MAQTAGPQMIVYLHCGSILCLLCGRNALVASFFKGLKTYNNYIFQARQEGPKNPPKKCTMRTIGFKNIMIKYSLCPGLLLWIPRSHITCLYWPP